MKSLSSFILIRLVFFIATMTTQDYAESKTSVARPEWKNQRNYPLLNSCNLKNWIRRLNWLTPPGITFTTTAEACGHICPGAVDVSAKLQQEYTEVPHEDDHDFSRGADPVCIIASHVHHSQIVLTEYDDCVFICDAQHVIIQGDSGDDFIIFEEKCNYNEIYGGSGDDQIAIMGVIEGQGNNLNLLEGGPGNDALLVNGSKNKLRGGSNDDILHATDDAENILNAGPGTNQCTGCTGRNQCLNC